MATSKRFIPRNGIDNNAQLIVNLLDPVSVQDAATKNYVDTNLALKAPLASPTFTGILTTPALSTTGTTGLALNNGTSNLISFNTNGVANPTFTTRSAGTKLLLYPNISASLTDFALGIENTALWTSVPNSTSSFKWYAGTSVIATLSGTGVLSTASTVATGSLILNNTAGTNRLIWGQTNGVLRWIFGVGSDGETGSNTGSNFYIDRHNDAGTSLGHGLVINRSSGLVTIDSLSISVAQGTAPISVTSTTVCPNLNATYVGGYAPNQVGGTGNRVVVSNSSGYINNTFFNMTANDIGDTAISHIVVEQNSDNYLRWQTPTNFVRRLNLGRVVNYAAIAQNGRLYPGPLWSFYYPIGYTTWYLPTLANTMLGDTIEIVSMHWVNNGGWSSSYTLTIAVDSNVRISTLNIGESLVLDDIRVQRITLTCNWVDATYASWSLS